MWERINSNNVLGNFENPKSDAHKTRSRNQDYGRTEYQNTGQETDRSKI